MNSLKKNTEIWNTCSMIVCSKTFKMFFLLNAFANFPIFIYSFTPWSIFASVGLAVLGAFFESVFCKILGDWLCNYVQKFVFFILYLLHFTTILIDYFLWVYFDKCFDAWNMELMIEANDEVAADFINTYFSWQTVVLLISSLLFFVFLFYLSRLKWHKFIYGLLIVVMTGTCIVPVYGLASGHGTMNILQIYAPSRFYLAATLHGADETQGIPEIIEISKNVIAERNDSLPIDIVVVIGESYSKYRCSLYGYPINTSPKLKALNDRGELFVYSDCICPFDMTSRNMSAIYSLSSNKEEFTSTTTFPVCFKKAGFYTALYDNQYVPKGFMVFNNPDLSKEMFCFRNQTLYGYDMNLVDALSLPPQTPSLTIIHLNGQHYEYANRYTQDFGIYEASLYSQTYTLEQREKMAHYDNATLYNDSVVSRIIDIYENRNAIIVYFPDHGEEIYDVDDFLGHGTAETTKDMRYQIEIPFMIWTSKQYKERHTSIINHLIKAQDYPISTNDVSHFLIDLAGIETPCLDKTRSFINPSYDRMRHRYVMDKIDYDMWIKENHD